MEDKLVSILMVNYNHQDTIGEAIKSVLDQTYENFQLVIVDDGSKDDSVKIIQTFDDARIELYQMDQNRHICEATNYGFTKIRGEYLARIDSDDLWRNDRLEKQLDYMSEHPDCRICFSWINLIDENGTVINDIEKGLLSLFDTNLETQKEFLSFFFYAGNCLCHSSVLMTRWLAHELGEFNRCFMQSHDFDYWVRVAKICPSMHVIHERLVSLRRYQDADINNSGQTIEKDTRFFNEYAEIRKHFFDDMSNEVFIQAFGEDFRVKTAALDEELKCEKAFLLCTPMNGTTHVPAAGMEALVNVLSDKKTRTVMEEKYHYTVKDFYKMSSEHFFYDAYLEKQKTELENRNKQIEEELHFKENELHSKENELHLQKEETQRLLGIINEYENSTSWKITRPVRKAGEYAKKTIKNSKLNNKKKRI